MNKYWSKRLSGIEAYTPGEQLNNKNIIKLNTNENPYPPSPKAIEALRNASNDSLRLYPETTSEIIRKAIGEFTKVSPECIFVGNGSDEILAFSFLAFFAGKNIIFNDITYSFYPVYGDFFGVEYEKVPLNDDFTIPVEKMCEKSGGAILPNPNAPTGIALEITDVEKIVSADMDRVVIIDEAYVDFGTESAVKLIDKYPNLLVVQTSSKSRSLAGIRVGWAIGNSQLIAALDCVKNCINSYTIDRGAQATAAAAVEDREYFENCCKKIMATRENAAEKLKKLGFKVLNSKANFLFVSHNTKRAEDIYKYLKDRNVLVRYFDKPRIDNFLRITIGTDEEMEKLFGLLEELI